MSTVDVIAEHIDRVLAEFDGDLRDAGKCRDLSSEIVAALDAAGYEIVAKGPKKSEQMTIVRLPPQDKPVYLALNIDWDEYAVDERQCPSDLFLGGCEQVIIDGDTDPHGLFEWVRTIDRPEFLSGPHTDDAWMNVVPEAFDHGTIGGTLVEVTMLPKSSRSVE